jgi:hypothetical protein
LGKEIAAMMGSFFIPAEVKSYISFQISSIIERLENPNKHFGEHAIEKETPYYKKHL